MGCKIVLKAGVIARHRGRVLLIRELNNRTGQYGWNIIKGTFEPGRDTSLATTALREAREEAGATMRLRHLLGTYYLFEGRKAIMLFVFIADLLNQKLRIAPRTLQQQYRKDEDIIELRLFTREGLARLKPGDFVGRRGYRAIQDYLAGKQFPLHLATVLPSTKQSARKTARS